LKQSTTNLKSLITLPSTYRKVPRIHPRIHAKHLDKTLGYRISKIEHKLLQKYRAYDVISDDSNRKQHYQGTQTWIGLHPQALQTPYNDIYDALDVLKNLDSSIDVEHIVDIGSGYGRVGLVMNSLFPKAQFTGFEVLKKREIEANRVYATLDVANCRVVNQDVLEEDFKLPSAQVFFIYDFSEREDICQILDQLSQRIEDENFYLITKGERVDFLLEKKYKKFWKKNGFYNSGDLKIFSSHTNMSNILQRKKNG